MGQKRIVLKNDEIVEEMARLKRVGKLSEAERELIESDLRYGLTKEEVELYQNKSFDLKQMHVISTVLKEHGTEVAGAIAVEGVDRYRMAVALEFFEKGISLEIISEMLVAAENAYELKECLKEELKKGQDEDASTDKKLKEENEKLVSDLEEQHQKVAEADALIAKLRSEADAKDKEIKNLKKMLEEGAKEKSAKVPDSSVNEPEKMDLKKEEKKNDSLAEEGVPAEKKSLALRCVPVHYAIDLPEGTVFLDRQERKTSGIAALVKKLGLKKKEYQDVLKQASDAGLDETQLAEIKRAITLGVDEKDLQTIIHSGYSATSMKEMIEISILTNARR